MKMIYSVKLFIFVFCLPITFYICGNIKTKDQAPFIDSEKAREKEELRDRILKRSARAYDNFHRVDPELDMRLKKINNLQKFIFACDVGLVVCFGVMIYCVSKIKR